MFSRALLGAELRTLRREPSIWTALPLGAVLGAGLAHYEARLLDEAQVLIDAGSGTSPSAPEPDPTPEPRLACEPGEGEHRAVAFSNPPPPWIGWYEPLVPEAEADVVVAFDGRDPLSVQLVARHADAEVRAVLLCLWRGVNDERQRRLDALGISRLPYHVAHIRFREQPGPPVDRQEPLPRPSPAGLGAAFLVLVSAMGWATDAVPKARRSGWLEGLWAMALPRATLWGTWCLTAGMLGTASAGTFLAGYLLAGGSGLRPTAVAVLPVLGLMLAVVSLRSMLRVPDMRAAGLVSGILCLAIMASTGLAYGLGFAFGPLAAAAVPVGGLVAAALGSLDPAAALLAIATALLAGVALHRSAVRVLECELEAGSFSRVALRRATGDYRPEALLLVMIAAAGATESAIFWSERPVLGMITGQLLFFALPALVAARVLALPVRPLLRLRAAPAKTWRLLPLLVTGAVATSSLAALAQQASTLSQPRLLDGYLKLMEALWESGGLLVLAVTPGICEELLFRGAVLGLLLRRGRPVLAVILQAALFGLIHVYAFKLLPAGALGLFLGVLAVRCGSIWPGVVVHVLHNAVLLLWADYAGSDLPLPTPLLLAVAAAVAGAGCVAAWHSGPPRADRESSGA